MGNSINDDNDGEVKYIAPGKHPKYFLINIKMIVADFDRVYDEGFLENVIANRLVGQPPLGKGQAYRLVREIGVRELTDPEEIRENNIFEGPEGK